jgi:hypothetical protein
MSSQKHFMDRLIYKNKFGGYITLLSVMVVGAVALSFTTAALMASVNSSKASMLSQRSAVALSLAKSCATEALEKMRLDNAFIGTGTITLPEGSCDYQVLNLGGQDREIRAAGVSEVSVKKIRVVIDALSPLINIAEWREVTEF